jgi:hypothetical protein
VNRVLLVDIGADPLPVRTPPMQIAATWAAAIYQPPPLAVPTGLSAQPIATGCVLSWTPTPGCETVVEVAPDVSGSPGAWALRTQTGNAFDVLPIGIGLLRWVRIKAVKHGRSSAWSSAVPAAAQVTVFGPGRNLLANGSFESNLVAPASDNVALRAGMLCDLWRVSPNTAASSYVKRTNVGALSGQWALEHRLDGQTIAHGQLIFGDGSEYVPGIADIAPGQRLRIRSRMTVSGTAALQGCVLTCYSLIVFYNAANTAIGAIVASTTLQSFSGTVTNVGTVPAGTVRTTVFNQLWFQNLTGSSKTLAANVATMIVDGVEVTNITNADDDIEDGTIHGRIAIEDTTLVSGVRRSGLRVGTSGQQIGDYRNLPTALTGAQPYYWTGLSITWTSAAAGTATINVSAATVVRGTVSVSYNAAAANLSGLAVGNHRVYLYYLDAASAGGSRTLNTTTNPVDLANSHAVQVVGSVTITIPRSGTSSGGGAIGDGGGLRPIPPGGAIP